MYVWAKNAFIYFEVAGRQTGRQKSGTPPFRVVTCRNKKLRSWFQKVPETDQQSKQIMWFWSVHYAIVTMTTVGYGDITPCNEIEVMVTIILCLFSTVVTAVFMGIIMNHVASMYEQSQARRTKMAELSKYSERTF